MSYPAVVGVRFSASQSRQGRRRIQPRMVRRFLPNHPGVAEGNENSLESRRDD
jgi:hypothetical protein